MEMRDFPRVDVSHPVMYLSNIYPRPNVALTLDLSQSGTRLKIPYSLMAGEGLEISIAIHSQVIKCQGKVIHVLHLEKGRMEAGIQFGELSPNDRLYLKQYIFYIMEQQAMASLSPEKPPS